MTAAEKRAHQRGLANAALAALEGADRVAESKAAAEFFDSNRDSVRIATLRKQMDYAAMRLRELIGAIVVVALVALLAACGATPSATPGPDGSGVVAPPSRDAGATRHQDAGVTCDATPDAPDVTPDATSQRCAPPRTDVTCPHDCCPFPTPDGGGP